MKSKLLRMLPWAGATLATSSFIAHKYIKKTSFKNPLSVFDTWSIYPKKDSFNIEENTKATNLLLDWNLFFTTLKYSKDGSVLEDRSGLAGPEKQFGRLKSIKNILQNSKADMICLQEVCNDEKVLTEITNFLENLGYVTKSAVYHSRHDSGRLLTAVKMPSSKSDELMFFTYSNNKAIDSAEYFKSNDKGTKGDDIILGTYKPGGILTLNIHAGTGISIRRDLPERIKIAIECFKDEIAQKYTKEALEHLPIMFTGDLNTARMYDKCGITRSNQIKNLEEVFDHGKAVTETLEFTTTAVFYPMISDYLFKDPYYLYKATNLNLESMKKLVNLIKTNFDWKTLEIDMDTPYIAPKEAEKPTRYNMLTYLPTAENLQESFNNNDDDINIELSHFKKLVNSLAALMRFNIIPQFLDVIVTNQEIRVKKMEIIDSKVPIECLIGQNNDDDVLRAEREQMLKFIAVAFDTTEKDVVRISDHHPILCHQEYDYSSFFDDFG